MNKITFLIGHYIAMVFIYLKIWYYRSKFVFLLVALVLIMLVVSGFAKVKHGLEVKPTPTPIPFTIPQASPGG